MSCTLALLLIMTSMGGELPDDKLEEDSKVSCMLALLVMTSIGGELSDDKLEEDSQVSCIHLHCWS
jgi:hypothetical protein